MIQLEHTFDYINYQIQRIQITHGIQRYISCRIRKMQCKLEEQCELSHRTIDMQQFADSALLQLLREIKESRPRREQAAQATIEATRQWIRMGRGSQHRQEIQGVDNEQHRFERQPASTPPIRPQAQAAPTTGGVPPVAPRTVQELNTEEEWEDVMKMSHHQPVVVDFYGTRCGPCTEIKPFFAELAETNPLVHFVSVNVHAFDDIALGARVLAMPTFQVYKNGGMVNQVKGKNPDALKQMVKDAQ